MRLTVGVATIYVKPTPLERQDMQDMYSEAIAKGAKFLEAPVSGSKVRFSGVLGRGVVGVKRMWLRRAGYVLCRKIAFVFLTPAAIEIT